MASCVSGPEEPQGVKLDDVDKNTKPAEGDALLGKAQRFYAETSCDTKRGYLPYIYCNKAFPTANEWILLTAGRASIDKPGDKPLVGAWVVGHKLLEELVILPNTAPGCVLMVEPLTVLFAWPRGNNPTAFQRIGAWREGSTAYLLINPTSAMVGHSIYVQWIESASDENLIGLLISHGYRLDIGDTTWPTYKSALPRQDIQ